MLRTCLATQRVVGSLALLLAMPGARALAQNNTWIPLTTPQQTRYLPQEFTNCGITGSKPHPVGRAYSGIAYGNGKLFMFGGGHASHPANDVELYDITANTWRLDSQAPECLSTCCFDGVAPNGPTDRCDNVPVNCTPSTGGSDPPDPSCTVGTCIISGGTGSNKVSPSGRPYTEHTFQLQEYHPVHGKFFGAYSSGTWEWNPSTRAWTRLNTGRPPSHDISTKLVIWEPQLQRMLFFATTGGSRGVYQWNDSSNSWSLYDSIPAGLTWGEPHAAYDSVARKIVLSYSKATTSWWRYDAPAKQWTENLNVPPELAIPCFYGSNVPPCFTGSLAYDYVNNLTAVLYKNASGTAALYAYRASTNQWFPLTMSGTPPGGGMLGFWQTMNFDPGTNHFYFVNIRGVGAGGTGGQAPNDVELWKWRLAVGTPNPTFTTGPATPTSPPGTPTRTPTAGPPPPTSGPTPPCTGTVRQVGPSRQYKKPSEAVAAVQSNDCVHIDAGNYPGDTASWPASADNVTLRGIGGMVRLVAQGAVAEDKAIWVLKGDNTVVENIEFACATSRTNNSHCSGLLVGDANDAGIRLEGAGLTVRSCIFHDNDNSILGGPATLGGNVLIEYSEFFRNGWGDGQSHNLYLNSNNASLTYRYNYSHGAIIGHQLKSRADVNYILYNRLMDEAGGTASFEIDLPDGGLSYVIGNVLQKSPGADNSRFISYAAENRSNPIQELYVVNNTFVSDYGGSVVFIAGNGTSPLLWAKNNIFYGTGTSITWPTGGTVVQNNNVTANPQLLSRSTYDYRLTASSSAVINQGAVPGTSGPGFNLAPTQHYVHDRGSASRPSDGTLDVGAFEYVAGATPFLTPTRTPTNTPTQIVAWTPTPASPAYCSAGDREAVFKVAASGDDGIVKRSGTSYSALGNGYQASGEYDSYVDYAVRKNASGTYHTQLVLWSWNTATRPDGTPWPAGTTVVSARVRPHWVGTGWGPRSLVFEWHSWAAPLSDAQWSNGSVNSSSPVFAASTSRPSAGGRQTISLSNAATNVNLSSYTGLRLTVADTGPPPAGEDTTVGVQSQDYQTTAGDRSAELVVCYRTGPTPVPSPPAPPTLL